MAGLRSGDDRGQGHARRSYLSRRGPRLQQRCDTAALQQSRGRRGVEANGRLVQQIRESHDLTARANFQPPTPNFRLPISNSSWELGPWELGVTLTVGALE